MTPEGRAILAGIAELPARKLSDPPDHSTLEIAADLALRATTDAGLSLRNIDGVIVNGIAETELFAPAAVIEYLGIEARFADSVDLGGASPAGMIWRAAAAISSGAAEAILCIAPGGVWPGNSTQRDSLRRFGSSSYLPGSPQAEFEIPFGHLGQNVPYAMIAQRYAYEHGYDHRALARLVSDIRANGSRYPGAIFAGKTASVDDILASPMVATPLRLLEIVMPVYGGAAVLVVSPSLKAKCRHRPVWLTGFGEQVISKSPHTAVDLLQPPLAKASRRAFAMASCGPTDMDVAQIYDCYSITVLLALEAAGFCGWGEGMSFLNDHDFTADGTFPLNTNGGQLGFGQAGHAGGMYHVTEAVAQIQGRAAGCQVKGCDSALVVGNGGIMSEQVALILQGD